MKLHSTPLSLCPTIHELPWVEFHIDKDTISDVPKGVLWGLNQKIGLARMRLKYYYLCSIFWPSLMCVLVIVLSKVILPLLHLQCFKAFHQPILQNLTIFLSIHLSSINFSTPYNPILSGYSLLHASMLKL